MTVTIELPAEIEASLLAQAEAEGLGVSDYLQKLVSGQVAAKLGEVSSPGSEWSPEEWVDRFMAWSRSHAGRNLPVLSDEAMSRESIYADRGV